MKVIKQNIWFWPISGCIFGLVICPLITILTGEINLYALFLLPLTILLWLATSISIRTIGIKLNHFRDFLLPFLYPIFTIGLIIFIAWIVGNLKVNSFSLPTVSSNILWLFIYTFVVGILTEEGFFRGWLWAVLEKNNLKLQFKLLWTSGIFGIWHYSITIISPDTDLPGYSIPLYIINIFLFGLNMGLFRQISGSIIITSFSHALWNALSYTLFGIGTTSGILVISSPWMFDNERGLIGIAANIFAVFFLWKWLNNNNKSTAAKKQNSEQSAIPSRKSVLQCSSV